MTRWTDASKDNYASRLTRMDTEDIALELKSSAADLAHCECEVDEVAEALLIIAAELQRDRWTEEATNDD